MVYLCPPVRKIIPSLKLVDYLHVQADNPRYNYYVLHCLILNFVYKVILALIDMCTMSNIFAKHKHHLSINESEVRKKAKIRNRYNQVPRLTKDIVWESNKNTRKHHTHESQEVSPFPSGDQKVAKNRHGSMAKTSTNIKKDPQQKHRLGIVSTKTTGGLVLESWYQPHP